MVRGGRPALRRSASVIRAAAGQPGMILRRALPGPTRALPGPSRALPGAFRAELAEDPADQLPRRHASNVAVRGRRHLSGHSVEVRK